MKWFFMKETVRKAQCSNVPNVAEFKKKGQSHYCGEKPKTIDEYIQSQDEEKQEDLRYMRQILRSALPEAEERISWSMPTYWKGHNMFILLFRRNTSDCIRALQQSKNLLKH